MLKISKVHKRQDVYDIQVSDNHNFYANNILVHNCEITHPTKPLISLEDKNAEIGVCILSALNMLEVKEDEYESVTDITLRILDEIIDYQDYIVKAAENFCKNRRSVGVGFTNLAGFLAKNKLKYGTPEALNLVHKYAEMLQYYLLKSSVQLAKEKGKCAKFDLTKYSMGILPIDTYKNTVDNIVSVTNSMDWESLRQDIILYGLRHSTVTAQMPCESSSVTQNSTNGIEPVRSLTSYKQSKTGVLKQVVPNVTKYGKYYSLAFDSTTNNTYTDTCAVIQKFFDMGISMNHYYNYAHYADGSIPLSTIIKDLIYAYKMGIKTIYYSNTPDGDVEAGGCASGACAI